MTLDRSQIDAVAVGKLLEQLRADGWTVAVHNDYRQNGTRMTFWLLTHPDGRYIKGEGETDQQALTRATMASRPPTEKILAKVIEEAISAIPASNPGYIEVCPTTLRDQLSRRLIEKISEVAARAALRTENRE